MKSKNPDPNRRPHNRAKDIAVRLWERTDRSGECWLWTGPVTSAGYGCFSFGNIQQRTHRVSYEIHQGPVPPGMYVCHTCDNRRCVRPDHLFAGTPKDNVDDMYRKGRDASPRGERNGQAKLTSSQVAEIRSLHGIATMQRMADDYGVSVTTIHNVVHRIVWRYEPA